MLAHRAARGTVVVIPGRPRFPRLYDCRDCHEPIRFVRMRDTGRLVPVNPVPDQAGTVFARLAGVALVGLVTSRDHRPGPLDPYRFVPHHATCEARKSSSKPPAEPHPALFE